VGVKCAAIIEGWQKRAHFSDEVEWVGEMIQEDARRCLELDEKIKRLEGNIAEVAKDSKIAKTLRSSPGYGATGSSELAGEIGTIERFSRKEASRYIRAVYIGQQVGMVPGHQGSQASNTAPKPR
jgi:transposase